MTSRFRWWLAGIGLVVATAFAAGATAAAAPRSTWRVTDLGTLGGASSSAVALNDHGWVVGQADTATGVSHAFLWRMGKMIDLGTLRGPFKYSAALAINGRGNVIGTSATAGGKSHAFLWRSGQMVDLGTAGGKFASVVPVALNERGQVTGTAYAGVPGVSRSRAFLWSGGHFEELGTLGGESSKATAINARGEVLGTSDVGEPDANGFFDQHAFLWSRGKMRDLGEGQFVFDSRGAPLRACGRTGCSGQPLAFNHHGAAARYCIVWSKKWGDQVARPCLWQPNGSVRDLGTLKRGDRGRALALNDKGQVVGRTSIGPPSGKSNAFLWEHGTMVDLGGLRAYDWSEADAINNLAQIVGISRIDRLHPQHAVFWTLRH